MYIRKNNEKQRFSRVRVSALVHVLAVRPPVLIRLAGLICCWGVATFYLWRQRCSVYLMSVLEVDIPRLTVEDKSAELHPVWNRIYWQLISLWAFQQYLRTNIYNDNNTNVMNLALTSDFIQWRIAMFCYGRTWISCRPPLLSSSPLPFPIPIPPHRSHSHGVKGLYRHNFSTYKCSKPSFKSK